MNAETVEHLLDALKAKRRTVRIGGCGDEACCGSYLEDKADEDGDHVRWEDVVDALREAANNG